MHLYHADIIANNLLNELKPFCEPGLCNIAGSVRRRKQDVKDIEIVCIPKMAIHKDLNLFGEVVAEHKIIHPEFERIIREAGTIIKGKFTGRYMQVEMRTDIEGSKYTVNLDLFMPQTHDYWRQFAIRTGSAEYARRFIAGAWSEKGWCGVEGDLYLKRDCYRESDQHPWKLRPGLTNPIRPPVWESEAEFFKWIGVQWLDPQHRNL